MKQTIKAIYLELPFWLKPFKRFIRFNVKIFPINAQLTGEKIDMIMLDEYTEVIKK